jgi:hypothetical protein
MEEVQAAANFSVIICSKHRRSPSVSADSGGRRHDSRALPKLGGAGFVGDFSMSSLCANEADPATAGRRRRSA